jgi:hypothetical protein
MKTRLTLNNLVMVRLDPENEKVGGLFIDTTYNPELHVTVTGKVFGLPSHLIYTGKANIGMPWDCPMEIKMGDDIVLFYLSVMNELSPQTSRYGVMKEGKNRFILVSYDSVYAIVRDDKIIPVNGYCLIEPCKNPEIESQRERMTKLGLTPITLKKDSITSVVYGIVRHIGVPNRRYVDDGPTDEGVDIAVGDTIVMKKVSDIPLQYDLHQKVNEGKKLFRVQRRQMFAKL